MKIWKNCCQHKHPGSRFCTGKHRSHFPHLSSRSYAAAACRLAHTHSAVSGVSYRKWTAGLGQDSSVKPLIPHTSIISSGQNCLSALCLSLSLSLRSLMVFNEFHSSLHHSNRSSSVSRSLARCRRWFCTVWRIKCVTWIIGIMRVTARSTRPVPVAGSPSYSTYWSTGLTSTAAHRTAPGKHMHAFMISPK